MQAQFFRHIKTKRRARKGQVGGNTTSRQTERLAEKLLAIRKRLQLSQSELVAQLDVNLSGDWPEFVSMF